MKRVLRLHYGFDWIAATTYYFVLQQYLFIESKLCSGQDMKDEESFEPFESGENMKDEELFRTGITDAMEMDIEMDMETDNNDSNNNDQ